MLTPSIPNKKAKTEKRDYLNYGSQPRERKSKIHTSKEKIIQDLLSTPSTKRPPTLLASAGPSSAARSPDNSPLKKFSRYNSIGSQPVTKEQPRLKHTPSSPLLRTSSLTTQPRYVVNYQLSYITDDRVGELSGEKIAGA